MPDVSRAIDSLLEKSTQVCTDRARLGIAMAHLYRSAGFAALVAATQGELRSLAAQIQNEGGSTEGWMG